MKKYAITVVLALLVLGLNPSAKASAMNPERELGPKLLAMSTPLLNKADIDGAEFIEKMIKSAEAYDDYTFEFTMTAYKSGTVVEDGKFFFKKPRLIRMEETGSFRHGSIAILGKNGKVKGKAGGPLGLFTVELSPHSSLLRSANGYPMVDSDLLSLAQALKQFLKNGDTARVTAEPTSLPAGNVYILEVYHDFAKGDLFKRVAVDSHTMLPVEWWDFENNKLVSRSIWRSFKGNIGLSDDVFTVKGEAK